MQEKEDSPDRLRPIIVFDRVWCSSKCELLLGLAGAAAATLLVLKPIAIGVVCVFAVIALSAMEVEGFLLLIILFLPMAWVLQTDLPLRNAPVALRSFVALGFFTGRLYRGTLALRDLVRPKLSRAALTFLGAVIASAIVVRGAWTRDSARGLYAMIADVGFFFVISAWADSKQRIRKVLLMLFYSTAVTLIFALAQEIVGGFTPLWFYLNPVTDAFQPWSGRAASFMFHPNSLAAYLDLVLPFALGCCVICGGKWRILGAWTLAVGFVVLLCTQSVGGLAAFGCMLVFAILWFARSTRMKVLLLSSCASFVATMYLARNILNPVHAGDPRIAYDAVTRLLLWNVAWELFLQSPLNGVGWGNFPSLYGSYLHLSWIPPDIFNVHNIYLQLLSETGILGFVAFSGLIVTTCRQACDQWKMSQSDIGKAIAFGLLGAMITVLVQGLTDFQFTSQFEALFWTLLALLVSSGRVGSRSIPRPILGG